MKHTYTSNELAKGAERQAQPTDTRRQRRGLGGFLTLGLLLVAAAGGIFWFVRTGSTLSVRDKADVAPDNSPGSHSENGSQKKVSDKDVVLYVESTEGEIRQLFEYVRQSALVQENVQYSSLMKDVGFAFDATNDEVNAVASRRIKEGGGETRLITCYAGEARFAKTIALAAAAELNGEKGEVAKMMGKMTPMLCFQLSAGDAVGLVRSCGLDRYLHDEAVLARAKSIAAGGIVGVLAHEVGHQVLGHNFQHGKDAVNNEVRRNWEAQADLFASSVMSSSPFGEYVFAGRVFALWVRMRQTDPILKKVPQRELSHPIDRERFVALILSNKEKAAALGIKIPEI